MRKIADIRKDLKAQIESVRAMDATADKAAYDAAVQKAVDLTTELDSATKIEAAQQRLAEKQFAQLKVEASEALFMLGKADVDGDRLAMGPQSFVVLR